MIAHAIVGLSGRAARGQVQTAGGEGVWEVPEWLWTGRLAFALVFLRAQGGGSMVVMLGEVDDDDYEQD